MIVALFVLSLAMLFGGIASVVQGIPFIRVEQGWTMVIAGAVVMSGGAILAGISTAVWRLRRIERELVAAREAATAWPRRNQGEVEPVAPATGPGLRREPGLGVAVPVPQPERLAPDERALLAAGDLMPSPVGAPDEGRSATDDAIDRLDLTPAPEAWTPEADAEAARRAKEAEDAGAVAIPEPEKPEEPVPRTVAGTYSSGGNNYVMYSDGSIEAETPTGRYTFQSLEELKAFASREEGAPGRDVA